ncbi:MAG: hypothetical protein HYZ72_20375 [Deltaproteobacteria bacterium]|nr:hypothetical protein [Deltaproteobacteria bacterium]
MPPKDSRSESQNSNPDTNVSMKRVERFLRLLTWQMFFLLAILLYLAMRPQAGRFQFTVAGEDVVVFDTASSRALAVKLQRQVLTPGEKAEPGTPPAGGEGK